MVDINFTERDDALLKLLRPISWPGGSDIWQRKEIVTEARDRVYTVLPFLTRAEAILAYDWLARERHEGLWD